MGGRPPRQAAFKANKALLKQEHDQQNSDSDSDKSRKINRNNKNGSQCSPSKHKRRTPKTPPSARTANGGSVHRFGWSKRVLKNPININSTPVQSVEIEPGLREIEEFIMNCSDVEDITDDDDNDAEASISMKDSPQNQPHLPEADPVSYQRGQNPNARVVGRRLVQWHYPRMIALLLLNIIYELKALGIKIPWDQAAHRLFTGASGKSAEQFLHKLRVLLLVEGHLVPPVLGRGNARMSNKYVRGIIRDFTSVEPNATRELLWNEAHVPRKVSYREPGVTYGSGNAQKRSRSSTNRSGRGCFPATPTKLRGRAAVETDEKFESIGLDRSIPPPPFDLSQFLPRGDFSVMQDTRTRAYYRVYQTGGRIIMSADEIREHLSSQGINTRDPDTGHDNLSGGMGGMYPQYNDTETTLRGLENENGTSNGYGTYGRPNTRISHDGIGANHDNGLGSQNTFASENQTATFSHSSNHVNIRQKLYPSHAVNPNTARTSDLSEVETCLSIDPTLNMHSAHPLRPSPTLSKNGLSQPVRGGCLADDPFQDSFGQANKAMRTISDQASANSSVDEQWSEGRLQSGASLNRAETSDKFRADYEAAAAMPVEFNFDQKMDDVFDFNAYESFDGTNEFSFENW